MKRIDVLIGELKKRNAIKKKPLNKICTLALGLNDGSIKWGDNRFMKLLEGDLMEKVGGTDSERGASAETEKT